MADLGGASARDLQVRLPKATKVKSKRAASRQVSQSPNRARTERGGGEERATARAPLPARFAGAPASTLPFSPTGLARAGGSRGPPLFSPPHPNSTSSSTPRMLTPPSFSCLDLSRFFVRCGGSRSQRSSSFARRKIGVRMRTAGLLARGSWTRRNSTSTGSVRGASSRT